MSNPTITNSLLVQHISEAKTRQKGRRVPELPTFLFKSVDVEVSIRRLGPFTMDEIRKTLKKQRQPPTVPTVVVEVGDAAVKLRESNPSDPNYQQELREYNTWLSTTTGEKMIDLMTNYCIVVEIDSDVVAEKRELLRMIDAEAEASYTDREVYIKHHLLSTTDDLEAVQNFILGRSMPTEEAVEEHIDSFQRDVQGETPVSTPGTAIRV